jgi:hypothetical protein
MKKIVLYVVAVVIGVTLFYGGKHIAHVKCVEAALDIHCKKNCPGYQKIESVDVPWVNPFDPDGYACTAKIALQDKTADVAFTAKKARLSDLAQDDWDVNLGFWGWLGDDYRIFNVRMK